MICCKNVSMNKKLKVFQPSAKRSNFTERCMNSHVVTKSHDTFSPEGETALIHVAERRLVTGLDSSNVVSLKTIPSA